MKKLKLYVDDNIDRNPPLNPNVGPHSHTELTNWF